MLKFAIVGELNNNTQNLIDEIKRLGHSCLLFRMPDVSFETKNNKLVAVYGDENICECDIVIFRAYNNHIYEAKLLAEMLIDENKVVIEQSLAGNYVRGKMLQAKRLFQCGINHPATFQANHDNWHDVLKKLEFPMIAKPVMGRKGRGIKKLENFDEAEDFFLDNGEEYLVQKYFPIDSDYRIFVVGGKVVGGFKRIIKAGEYKSNIHGTKAEKIEVNEEIEKIAINSTRAMGYEIAGVDLFEHAGKLYIIEVNVCPQWEKFKNITNINPAEKIIEYALDKHSRKK